MFDRLSRKSSRWSQVRNQNLPADRFETEFATGLLPENQAENPVATTI
jgi:hypothetical protein